MPKGTNLVQDCLNGHLIVAQKYRITYKAARWQYARTAVMSYLSRSILQRSTSWNARPFAGTQEMPDEWITAIELVDNNTTPYMHRRA